MEGHFPVMDHSETVVLLAVPYQGNRLFLKLPAVFERGFFPHESILIGAGLDLRAVNKYVMAGDVAVLIEPFRHLREDDF